MREEMLKAVLGHLNRSIDIDASAVIYTDGLSIAALLPATESGYLKGRVDAVGDDYWPASFVGPFDLDQIGFVTEVVDQPMDEEGPSNLFVASDFPDITVHLDSGGIVFNLSRSKIYLDGCVLASVYFCRCYCFPFQQVFPGS